MKITRIRNEHGQVLTGPVMMQVVNMLGRAFKKAGFITEVTELNPSSIKVGLWMRSFKLDVSVHDRNLQHNPHLPSKLTTSPTWQQRVEFNDLLNGVLDLFSISANIKSGPYTIRKGSKAMTEDDWNNQKPDWTLSNEFRGYYVEAIDEREYLKERRVVRNFNARQKRKAVKQGIVA